MVFIVIHVGRVQPQTTAAGTVIVVKVNTEMFESHVKQGSQHAEKDPQDQLGTPISNLDVSCLYTSNPVAMAIRFWTAHGPIARSFGATNTACSDEGLCRIACRAPVSAARAGFPAEVHATSGWCMSQAHIPHGFRVRTKSDDDDGWGWQTHIVAAFEGGVDRKLPAGDAEPGEG